MALAAAVTAGLIILNAFQTYAPPEGEVCKVQGAYDPCVSAPLVRPPQEPQGKERPRPVPESWYGVLVPFEEARSKANFPVLVPSKLSGNMTLQRVRMTESNDRVTLFYSQGFTIYEEKIKENFNQTGYVEALEKELMKPGSIGKRFSYAGADGVGVDPQQKEAGKPDLGSGALTFYRDNVQYSLYGNLTFAELSDITVSMLQP